MGILGCGNKRVTVSVIPVRSLSCSQSSEILFKQLPLYIYIDTIICISRQFDSNREEYESSKIPELKILSAGYVQTHTVMVRRVPWPIP
jgi:hypothetical protein